MARSRAANFRQLTDEELEEEQIWSAAHLDLPAYLEAGIVPGNPTKAKPGSEEKIEMLAARYAAGEPLWHTDDCYDHGPKEQEIMGESRERLEALLLL